MRNISEQKGAASIFVVIFAALTLSLITTSFMAVIMQQLRSATDNDLSQSAYNSAMAGVEDAKLALSSGQIGTESCKATSMVNAPDENGEWKIGLSSASSIDQAYTCVDINQRTNDVEKNINIKSGDYIKLKGVSDVKSIVLEWTRKSDYRDSSSTLVQARDYNPTNNTTFDRYIDTGASNRVTAPYLRANYIKLGPDKGSVQLSNYDKAEYNFSVFAKPNVSRSAPSSDNTLSPPVHTGLTVPQGEVVNNYPQLVGCSSGQFNLGNYACSAKIKLKNELPKGDIAYIWTDFIYSDPSKLKDGSSMSVRVTMYDSSNKAVDFDGVQPRVDSTGRANDVFRRVSARVEQRNGSVIEAPNYTIDLDSSGGASSPSSDGGSLCKNFSVWPRGYSDNADCL